MQESVFNRLFEVAEIAQFSRREQEGYENSLKYYRDMKKVFAVPELEARLRTTASNRMNSLLESFFLLFILLFLRSSVLFSFLRSRRGCPQGDEVRFDQLREASAARGGRPVDDKRLTQARRAIEKASRLLRGGSED